MSLFKGLGFAKLRCKKNPLKAAVTVSPIEAAADASVPEIARRMPHDRCGRFKPNADAAALVDISALGGYSTDDILGGQYRCHVAATLTGRLPSHAIVGVNRFSTASLQITRVYPRSISGAPLI